jgi:hypothetical protein
MKKHNIVLKQLSGKVLTDQLPPVPIDGVLPPVPGPLGTTLLLGLLGVYTPPITDPPVTGPLGVFPPLPIDGVFPPVLIDGVYGLFPVLMWL